MKEPKVILTIVFVVLLLVVSLFMVYGTQETVSVTVVKTERVVSGESSKYLVFTEDETFKNSDTIWYLKFNSSDIYGRLEPGEYQFDVYGYRIPLLSSYRNIIEVKE